MIDCHCHLADEQFTSDIDEVVARARQAGVIATLVCAEFKDQFAEIFKLSKRFPDFCFPCIGMHPIQRNDVSIRMEDMDSVDEFIEENSGSIAAIGERNDVSIRMEDMDSVDEFIEENSGSIAAIGEVGLDFTPRYIKLPDAKDVQIAVFRRQIELAMKLDRTLNVHSRSAGRPVINLLRECGAKRVLLHAFSGNSKNAQPAIEAGYYFSIPPSFSLSDQKVDLVSRVPLSQLCLETDSPVLGPSKTERNEPENIRISADFIARVKGVSLEEVVKVTTENAIRLFPMLNRLKLTL
ncbi:Putative deoxyribonuclease TATDN3 [Toxocara canis]|uniref:Putative deoxyribonuclease TATDN3 n=1 Tax=Toxocara canis TaxID=6265 RepID=A0A0B2VYN7_TOXCA|nr:Putative deoxyribonuclease TATDN3 [Toxocara canis]